MKTRILKIFLTVFVLSIAVGDAWAESFTLKYEEEGPTFKGTIEGRGFKPNAPYILSINGKVGRDGNKTLLSYGKWSGEGYYDFDNVKADESGRLSYKFEVKLPRGKYDVTFLVKDVSNNYKAVYIKNYVRFTIK